MGGVSLTGVLAVAGPLSAALFPLAAVGLLPSTEWPVL